MGPGQVIILSALLIGLSACQPRTEPRWSHEGPKSWDVKHAPQDQTVAPTALESLDLKALYAREPMDVLRALKPIVLNGQFILSPQHRTAKLTQAIALFHSAFLKQLNAKTTSEEFNEIRQLFMQTVFAGCARDLSRNECTAADLFASQPGHTRIWTLLAEELELKAPQCVKDSACRNQLEERYRRLSMAIYRKRDRMSDAQFTFAYVRYAREYAELLEYLKDDPQLSPGYLASIHGPLFQTIIANHQPGKVDPATLRQFIDAYRPWQHSNKSTSVFQYGTNVILDWASKCCMYEDAQRTIVSQGVLNSIRESQGQMDHMGASFTQRVAEIRQEHGDRLFQNLGLLPLVQQIDAHSPKVFNEFFFIVDRVFRGHLSSQEAERILLNTNPDRARTLFPYVVQSYLKIYLAHMVMRTNLYMATIYNRTDIPSAKIFEETVVRSRALTDEWHGIKSQIGLLERLLATHFKESKNFEETYQIIKSVDRNIHYVSVFPNMMVMVYFISKASTKLEFQAWRKIEIEAATAATLFFDGKVTQPWFAFAVDSEPLDRLKLLYALEYLLSTEALKAFVDKEKSGQDAFFEQVLSKYLENDKLSFQQDLETMRNLSRKVNESTSSICDYELGRSSTPVTRVVSFKELADMSYTGMGTADVNNLNGVFNEYFRAGELKAQKLRREIGPRRLYLMAMERVIAAHLLRTRQIQNLQDDHPYLSAVRRLLKELAEFESELKQTFLPSHSRLRACALRLTDVERGRTNALYDAERRHLGEVFDAFKTVFTQPPERRAQAIRDADRLMFRQRKALFDGFDGYRYRLSKYDLLERMRQRVERNEFPRELQRPVRVDIPPGLERDDIKEKGVSHWIDIRGPSDKDREDFIREAMQRISSSSEHESFLLWHLNLAKDTSLVEYLKSLREFYLLGREISPLELATAYRDVWASYSLSAQDVRNARDFGVNGRFGAAFFHDQLFEGDGQTSLPLFFGLQKDLQDSGKLALHAKGSVEEAPGYAKAFNTQLPFLFPPSDTVREAVREIFGGAVHQQLTRVNDLNQLLRTDRGQALRQDARLAQPFFLLGSWEQRWSHPSVLDPQRAADHRILVEQFIQRTGNFYRTKDAVGVQ